MQAALAEAKRVAATGIFLVSTHADERMSERRVTRRDIQAAIASAVVCTWQAKEQTWILSGGTDRKGDALTVVVALVNGMVIVTVY